ncbi:hypothetical protein [Mesorhizobium sp. M0859]|uniref:hypothetical protein n=1 Tax=Mesorhizobium sp. M0859 TaxID=2957014 RepID=UPI0033359A45
MTVPFRPHGQLIKVAEGIDLPARRAPDVALHKSAGNQMTLRIRLPGGTLKIKTYRELRARERDRRVPVTKVGSIYLIWWSNKQTPSEDQ